jgi:two-component system response regulator HydG
VVLMTAFGNIESAVDAIQRGAFHYVTKPFKMAAVRVLLERAARERLVGEQNQQLRTAFRERFSTNGLVGESVAMRALKTLIERVANAPSPVLIVGETGTGKEIVARTIHVESARRDASFVAVNCAALPETLLESELFGHARGAFTGATQVRRGVFVEADRGTLFLDEVGDMPLALQGKLLRVLQSGEIRAVGGESTRRVDVRCIAATQRDLRHLVQSGEFREDLFFRLNVVPVRLPPLRERREDIPLLVEHLLSQAQQRLGGAARRFTPSAFRALEAHSWPGNVRELDNVIERLLVTSTRAEIDLDSVLPALILATPADPIEALAATAVPLEELERRYREAVLRHTQGNKAKAAAILGVDPSTLYRKEKLRRS